MSLVTGTHFSPMVSSPLLQNHLRISLSQLVGNVALDVFRNWIFSSPWDFSRMINFRVLGSSALFLNALVGVPLTLISLVEKPPLTKYFAIWTVSNVFCLLDISGLPPLSTNIFSRIALDTSLLVNKIFLNSLAIYAGCRQIERAFLRNGSSQDGLEGVTAGLINVGIHTTSFASAMSNLANEYKNIYLFNQKDPLDQQGILKYRAIHTLNETKTCKAAVIDGITTDYFDRSSAQAAPLLEEVFRNCDTKYYRVNSSLELCSALNKSTDLFKQKLNVLSLHGHGNELRIELSKNYFLQVNDREITDCLSHYMEEDAQVLLLGCKNGKGYKEYGSLASYFSKILPNREVLASSENLNHDYSHIDYDKKFFWKEYDHYKTIGAQIIRRFVNGTQQEN